jgi:hypothetical protein
MEVLFVGNWENNETPQSSLFPGRDQTYHLRNKSLDQPLRWGYLTGINTM